MDEGDLYFSPVLSDSYNEDFSRSPSSDGDFSSGIDFPFEGLANPFESFDNPWAAFQPYKQEVPPVGLEWSAQPTPPVWKMDAPPVMFKTEATPSIVPPVVNIPMAMVPPSVVCVEPRLPFMPNLLTPQLQQTPLTTQHRGKRRKLEADKEVVTQTPPSTPPYVTSNGEARLDLSREELLSLTSEQFEDLIGQVRNNRDLTPAEKREIKKQRRLIKNRESAHASRQRKKDYVSELEKKLADLSRENVRLTQVINAIQGENTLLRTENQFYKGRGQITSLIPETIQRGVSFLSQQLQVQQQHQQQLHNHLMVQQHQPNTIASSIAQLPPQPAVASRAKTPNKTGGVLLMVLLFSFGVMFGNLGFPATTSPITAPNVQEVPRVFQREEYKPLSNTPMSDLSEHEVSDMMRERLRRRIELPPQEAIILPQVNPNIKQEVIPSPEVQSLSDPVLDLFPRLHKLDPNLFKSNTTYLVCNQIHKFDPALDSYTNQQEQGRKLSFLIPPSSFEEDGGGGEKKAEESLLVVTCEVTEVSMLPLVAACNA